MTGSWVSRIGFPLLGLAGLLTVLGSAGLTYAVYNKAFTETASVTVVVEQLGEQLGIPADVKVRGVRVGEVRSSTPDDAGKVVLELALEPAALADIPADVTARILPKTLFGERYVELVAGAAAGTTGTLAEGAVVAQDMSERSVQLQEVFDELGPLLRTVQPADLNATLSSLAAALAGRGEELGGTLDRLGAYVAELRPLVPQLQTDLTLLADVTARYGEAAPALLATARNASTTARTLEEREQLLGAVLADTWAVSDRTAALLAENEERLVQLSSTLRPTLELLAEYSPEYGCVFNGAKLAVKRIYDVFGGDDGPFKIKGRLRLGQSRGVYSPSLRPDGELARDLVAQLENVGPSCPKITAAAVGGVPGPDIPDPVRVLLGSYRGPLGVPVPGLDTGRQEEEELDGDEPATTPALPSLPGLPLPRGGPSPVPVLGDPTGSAAERRAIEDAAAAALGRLDEPVNPVTSLLLGPMLRGMTVEEAR